MSIKNTVMPPLVLTVICTIISCALIFANDATKERVEQINKETLNETLTSAFGEGTYTETDKTFEGVDTIIEGEGGLTVYEITTDGYNSDGIHVLVGIKDKAVKGVSFISCSETPGLGTKVNNKDYLKTYVGIKSESEADDADAVTGATFSSKGLKTAVKLALQADKEVRHYE